MKSAASSLSNVYRNIEKDPSREHLLRALRQAENDGLISAAGVRSPVWETDLHYRFLLAEDEPRLVVQLEASNGAILSTHPWAPDKSRVDFYEELVQSVRVAGRDLGVGLNPPTQSVEELARMLVDVSELRAQELMGHRQSLRKIIERVNGWYFTEEYVIPSDNLQYTIEIGRLDEMDGETHLRDKVWLSDLSSIHRSIRVIARRVKPGMPL